MKKLCLVLSVIFFTISCGKIRYVSIPCPVSMPVKPELASGTVENVKDLLIYTELLEASLKACL